MKADKAKREKRLNLIGASCGMFLALLLVINVGSGMVARAASANAQTLTASAPGKVGDVTVQVKADDKKIYEMAVCTDTGTLFMLSPARTTLKLRNFSSGDAICERIVTIRRLFSSKVI